MDWHLCAIDQKNNYLGKTGDKKYFYIFDGRLSK